MEVDRRTGVLFVFIAAVLYSIGGLCIKVIPWSGIAINGGRTAIALVVIGAFLAATRHPPRLNRWIFLGAVCVFGTNLLYAVANKLTTAANTIVLQFTAPIFVIVFSLLFWHKRPRRLDLIACAVVFGGVLFFFVDSLEMGGGLGNFLALLSGVSYAAILSLVVLGVFQVALAYILLAIGLKTTPPVMASLVSGIEPVLNPILVAVFYQEYMGPFALVGAAVVIVGVVGYNVIQARQTAKSHS